MKDDAVAKNGAGYVKRMMERTKENASSPVNRGQSIKTRIRIFESIESGSDAPAESAKQGFSSGSHKAEKWCKKQLKRFSPPSEPTLRRESAKLPRNNLNCRDKENRDPNGEDDRIYENARSPLKNSSKQRDQDNRVNSQSRLSVGHYFKAKSQKDLLKNFYNKQRETEVGNETAELYRRESERFFGPQVLTVIEPEIEHQDPIPESTSSNRRRCSDLLLVQESFEKKTPLASSRHNEAPPVDQDLDKYSSEERWKVQRNNVDGGLYQNFANVVVNKDYANQYPNGSFSNDQIVETPVRTFEIDTGSTNKFKDLTKLPTLEKSFSDSSPTMYFQRNNPIHESTRRYDDRKNPSEGFTTTETTPKMTSSCKDEISPTMNIKESTPISHAESPQNKLFVSIESYEKSNSSDVTDLVSIEKTPTSNHVVGRKVMTEDSLSALKTPMTSQNSRYRFFPPGISMSETRSSSRFDSTRAFCKSLSRRFSKSFLGPKRSTVSPPQQNLTSRADFLNPVRQKKYEELLKRSEVEEDRMAQACKALETCKSSRRFVSSQERVEAERFLILTTLTKNALSSEIARFAGLDADDSLYCERGRITLSDFSLVLREDLVRLRQSGELVEWFIIVVRSGLVVWASHAVPCPVNSPLYFPGEVSIPDLGPDFQVTVTVYSTVLEHVLYNHEVKFGTQDASASKKLTDKICFKRSSKGVPLHQSFEKSKKYSFAPCGNLDITLFDLKDAGPWSLQGVPSKSVLQGSLRMNIKCELQLSVTHAGFLTYASNAFLLSYDGDEAPSIRSWNRRWCLLKGQSLLLWNYPDDQESHMPIFSIDLAKCVSEQVGLADRTICARSRTLIIETCWRRNDADCQTNCSHTRHFLSFDSSQELTEWQSKLNHVISSLQQWNVIRASNGLSDGSV